MKLYLDDIRNPEQTYPYDTDWLVVRNYTEFISALEKHFLDLEIISFDHDIDSYDEYGNELTGYDCVKYLCNYIQNNSLDSSRLRLNFHSANPVGKENMRTYWQNFKNHYRNLK